jgi:hypothetical protein
MRALSAGVVAPVARGLQSNVSGKGNNESREYRERRERTVVSQYKSSGSEKQAVALEKERSGPRMRSETQEMRRR